MSELTGKLIVKNETKEFGNNGFKKREFVIETDSKYPQKILIELIKEKCSLLDSIEIGNTINISYNLNGREWTNPQGEVKYFNSIQAWKIEGKPLQGQAPLPTIPDDEINKGQEEDKLPF